ncbi:MAG: THUMP domain-containing protein [Candidatus Woesearchaeota archaeon]
MVVLVRYAEIGIKGKNRERFEKILVRNIESCLKSNDVAFTKVRRAYGRIIIETADECSCLRTVFGIASFSKAIKAGKTVDEAASIAKNLVEKLSENDSFRVSCQRLDKRFPLKSSEFCARLGEKLGQSTKAKVRLENPAVDVQTEIVGGEIYLLNGRVECAGGMPVGCQGDVVVAIEDDASVVAALMIMKRGCNVILAMMNDVDVGLLRKFSCGKEIRQIKISSVSELDDVIVKQKALAAVLNDAFNKTSAVSLKALVLRPLSGMDEKEIENERKKFERLAG